MATSIKISQLPAKGSNLEATDLLEVSEFNGTGYVSKSITGQEIIDSVPASVTAWGTITGTLSAQTDLNTALNGKQDDITLTTTGTSGASTFVANTLNVPTYSLSGLGGVPTSRTLTINGTTQDLSADRTFTISTGITIGTTAITSGTVGRVLFEGTGNVVQESANLFWDNTNGYLGSGTSSPLAKIHAIGGQSNTFKAQSTTADMYNQFISTSGTGEFGIYQDSFYFQALTSLSNGIQFLNGTTGVMKFTQTGNLLINTTTDAGFKLDVNGTARVQGSLTIPSTGNFGISITRSGTSGIAQQVYNNGGTTYLGADNSSGGFLFTSGLPYASFFGNGSNYPTQFGTNGAVRMTIFAGGNVGINTTTDVASSKLTIESTTQGFLPPRMTTTQKNAIASPAEGLQVWDTTLKLMSVYNGTTWITL